VLEKLQSVYSIQLPSLPFGTGAQSPVIQESEIPRVIRNQIAIRGAKVAGRTLTSVGAAAVGYSVALGRKPTVTKTRTPLPMTRRQFLKDKKLMKGSSRAYGDPSQYSFRKPGMSDRGTRHYEKPKKVQRNRRRIKVNTLRGAGTLAMFSGQVVPLIAYGYVAGQYIDLGTRSSGPRIDTTKVSEDIAYLHTVNLSQITQGLAAARTTYHLTKAVVKRLT